jgi:hypothetical protein
MTSISTGGHGWVMLTVSLNRNAKSLTFYIKVRVFRGSRKVKPDAETGLVYINMYHPQTCQLHLVISGVDVLQTRLN